MTHNLCNLSDGIRFIDLHEYWEIYWYQYGKGKLLYNGTFALVYFSRWEEGESVEDSRRASVCIFSYIYIFKKHHSAVEWNMQVSVMSHTGHAMCSHVCRACTKQVEKNLRNSGRLQCIRRNFPWGDETRRSTWSRALQGDSRRLVNWERDWKSYLRKGMHALQKGQVKHTSIRWTRGTKDRKCFRARFHFCTLQN